MGADDEQVTNLTISPLKAPSTYVGLPPFPYDSPGKLLLLGGSRKKYQ